MTTEATAYYALRWHGDRLELLDQRALPAAIRYCSYTGYRAVAEAIQQMVVRGAPAIGVAAAYGLVLAASESKATTATALRTDLAAAAAILRNSRPTAVNLFWALDRLERQIATIPDDVVTIRAAVAAEANAIEQENARTCEQIGQQALPLIPDRATIFHHCNTGALATGHYGTALGVIRAAHEAGKQIHVFVDETRPRLQGARLTTWELQQLGIPHTLVVDGASGQIMRTQRVDLCVVGCDRVAANGDTANKIGTYNLALVAQAHGVPFYVAGPCSTLDLTLPTGETIPIEERDASEVTQIGSEVLAPPGTPVANPAFDVTPAHLITAIITEVGIAYPPFAESLPARVKQARQSRAAR